jgi:hypothetical protein
MRKSTQKRLRLPFFTFCAVVAVVLIIENIYVVVNVILLMFCLYAIATILRGRNPWWLESRFLDRRRSKARSGSK